MPRKRYDMSAKILFTGRANMAVSSQFLPSVKTLKRLMSPQPGKSFTLLRAVIL